MEIQTTQSSPCLLSDLLDSEFVDMSSVHMIPECETLCSRGAHRGADKSSCAVRLRVRCLYIHIVAEEVLPSMVK